MPASTSHGFRFHNTDLRSMGISHVTAPVGPDSPGRQPGMRRAAEIEQLLYILDWREDLGVV